MIEVEGLAYTYPGAVRPVLDGLEFHVGRGEVFGLLGPSGAGKSTTQKILMGLLRPDAGRATVFGAPIASQGRSYYERIGVSFELPALYLRLSAIENLRLFAALYDRPTRDPMEVLALLDLAADAGKRVEAFSKGMKMRLNLCRALLHDPELLFLDEPTTGQDPARARLTRELVKKLRQEGKTVFVTTHNMPEAEEICDRVAFLSGGRIPVCGTPAELKRQYGRRTLQVSVRRGDGIESVDFPMNDIGGNEHFLDLIRTAEVVSMHTLEASLDDIFIKVTSGSAEATEPA